MAEPTENSGFVSLRGEIEEVRLIATGGMSEIFRAKQPSLNRYIVIKRLKQNLLSDAGVVERFRREARALASLLHQNIAHVYDFVEGTRESFILMEFIEGVDLSGAIERVGSLPTEVAASIMLGVAKGVNYIHSRNLIHRDIKPHNIRLSTRGEVKLMDFGIVMDLQVESLTRPGVMVGSPHYLSPEQVLGDRITPAADQFLLGIVLYEMLTGTRPFKDENNETVFQRIRETRYIPARRMNPKIPGELATIVKTLLQKRPEDRYESVRDLISALEKFLGSGLAVRSEDIILEFLDREAILAPSVTYAARPKPPSPWKPLLTWQVGAIAASAALLAFLGGWGIGRAFPPKPATPAADSANPAYPPAKAAGKSSLGK